MAAPESGSETECYSQNQLICCVVLGGALALSGQTSQVQAPVHWMGMLFVNSLSPLALHNHMILHDHVALVFLQAQKKPAVLCGFLLETTTFMRSNLSRIRIAACGLAGEWADVLRFKVDLGAT